ncbi:hypothetical protein OVA19_00990 [Streptomyces sp. SL203]|nr:hypothetical protein [Streptomyces sp. SL203]MCY1649396.1 hypothetical protein [Streptomyces sp. SL203]
MLVRQVPSEEEDLDECAGAVSLAVGLDGSVPPGVVDGGEPACGAGLVERGRSREGAGLAHESFQVVVQFESGAAFGDQPFVPGDFVSAVVDDQPGGVQHRSDVPADQPDRHRVAVGTDADLAVAVDPQGEEPARLEGLLRQRHQQRLLGREVLADRARTGPDPAGLVLLVPSVDHRAELGECRDLGHRDEVVAAEPADLPLDPALLVGAADSGLAVESFQADLPWVQKI